MPQMNLDILAVVADEQASPQLSIHPHPNRDDGLAFNFFRSPLSSETVQFDMSVDDITKYPNNHTFNFSLRSPEPHSDQDLELLAHLSQLDTKGKTVRDILKTVGSSLVIYSRYCCKSLAVPDDKTTVVAVLGSSNAVDDDWMASDFCLFRRALGGTAKQETWLTCVSLPDLVIAHGPIIHGSPYCKPRRVVFDDTSEDFTTLVPISSISSSFLTTLQIVAQRAVPGDHILVIVVAHGCKETGDITVGNEYISRDTLEMSFAGINNGVKITIVTTACYSGIWAVPFGNPRATITAATDSDHVSSGLLQKRLDVLETVMEETPHLDSILTKIVSVHDLTSKAVHSAPRDLSGSYAQRLVESIRQKQHNIPATSLQSLATETKQTTEVLGRYDERSTLFRIGAILELPKEANFSSIAFAAGSFITYQKTFMAQEGPWASRARMLYKQLALRSPGHDGSVDTIQIMRYARKITQGILSEEKCEELARKIWDRFRSDDQAQGIVSMLGFVCGKQLPRITDWDWDAHLWSTSVEHRRVISAFHPLEPTYGKPSAFLRWAATECSVTVELLGDILNASRAVPMVHSSGTSIPPSCSLKSLASMESIFKLVAV